MHQPLITIITVSYNAFTTIEQTILSIINQSYSNIEYIIIDGGSKDGTLEIIKKYNKYITYWISERDNGIYDAMNKGIQIAHGDIINFMNAGDIFYNRDVITNISKCVENRCVIYGKTYNIFKYGKLPQPIKPFWEYSYNNIPELGFCHQSVFISTTLIKNMLFDCKYKICADHKMLYELKKQNIKFIFYDDFISEIIAYEGYSIKNYKKKIEERISIYNVKYTPLLKLKVLTKSYINAMKTIVKSFIPKKIEQYRFSLKKEYIKN